MLFVASYHVSDSAITCIFSLQVDGSVAINGDAAKTGDCQPRICGWEAN